MDNVTLYADAIKLLLRLPEWLLGVLLGSILAFFLTIIWDYYKFRRDIKSKDEAILSTLYEEVSTNLVIVKNNGKLVQKELSILHQSNTVTNPLQLLRGKAWELVVMNLPQVLIKEKDILRKVREIYLIVDEINETVRSRESYKLMNEAMTNFTSKLKNYDTILSERGEVLLRLIEEIMQVFKDKEIYL